jgi:hypothetical protein
MLTARFLLTFLPALLINGCGSNATVDSTDVNEEKIFQTYSIDFDVATKKIHAFAQFTLGNSSGTTIRLTDPSIAKLDGTAMTLKDGDKATINIIGTYYTAQATGEKPNDNYVFSWTRTDGKEFKNIVIPATSVAITSPAADAEITGANDLEITFDGIASSTENGDVSVTVSSTVSPVPAGKTGSAAAFATAGANKVTIPAKDFSKLPAGPAEVLIRRYKTQIAENANEGIGGSLHSYYSGYLVKITIK